MHLCSHSVSHAKLSHKRLSYSTLPFPVTDLSLGGLDFEADNSAE